MGAGRLGGPHSTQPSQEVVLSVEKEEKRGPQHREHCSVLCDELEGWDGGGVVFKREGVYAFI